MSCHRARAVRRFALLVAVSSVVIGGSVGSLAAQQGQPSPSPTTTLPPPDPRQPVPSRPDRIEDPASSVWVRPPPAPAFQGFPIFPSALSGYGRYPGQGLAPTEAVPALAPAEPDAPGWPAWTKLQVKAPLPFAEDLALLVRHSDRVWWRAATEEVFIPLFFHDKFTTLAVGAQVEVRQAGEFELLLHDSTRAVALGPTALRLAAMDAASVTVEVDRLTRLRLQVTRREHTFVLPDRSKLRMAPAVEGAPPTGPAEVIIARLDEPGWLGGRATMFNSGFRDVLLQHAFGETTLAPGQRLTFFLQPPAAAVPASMLAEGVAMQADQQAVYGRAMAAGHVSWCGARFQMSPGSLMRFDPLQGSPFAAPPPSQPPDPLLKTP